MAQDAATIASAFTRLLKAGRQIIDEGDRAKQRQFHEITSSLHLQVRELNTMLQNLSGECCEASLRQRDDDVLDFQFVYKKNGMLTWGSQNQDNQESPEEKEIIHTISTIDGVSIDPVQIPAVSSLDRIPPAIYWYAGDPNTSPGVYMRVGPATVANVPFPSVANREDMHNRVGSIKCKHGTSDACSRNRRRIANRYQSAPRGCTFAHIGDKLKKVGMAHRAQSMPWIGAHRTFRTDIKRLPDSDINTLLMYSLSDLMMCHIWCGEQAGCAPSVLDQVGICS